MKRFLFLPAIFCLLLFGCSGSPQLSKQKQYSAVPADEQIYLVPFTTVMVPREVDAAIFDTFVDHLIAAGEAENYDFVILKQGPKAVDASLRSRHYLVTGEIFAYVEESGCCNTTLRVRSRIKLFQPGESEPTLLLEYPLERFYNHDYSTLAQQRRLLAEGLATALADQLSDALAGG